MPSTTLTAVLAASPACTEFRKVHGAGNDFIFINGPFEHPDLPGLARDLCNRRTGIGADGLVISTRLNGRPPAYEVRCLNADGSEATMCGNALRCAALCAAADHGHTEVAMIMATIRHQGEVRGCEVAVTAEAGPVLRAAAVVEDDGAGVADLDPAVVGEPAVVLVCIEVPPLPAR